MSIAILSILKKSTPYVISTNTYGFFCISSMASFPSASYTFLLLLAFIPNFSKNPTICHRFHLVLNSSAISSAPVDEIPFDTVSTMILPAFFIDGLAIDTDQFCEDNEIEKADLISYLTGEAYLTNHRVVYRYLLFTWENGVITDIRSESMDYNEDASYYEAN